MSETDEAIGKLLTPAQAEAYTDLGREPSLWQMIWLPFRGRNGWVIAVAWIESIIFTVMMVICAVKFFHAEAVRGMVGWATGFLTCFMITVVIKMWYWGQIMKCEMLRKAKRTEIMLGAIARKLAG